MQLVIAFVYTLVMLLFTSITEPYALKTCDYFSLLCNFSLVAVFDALRVEELPSLLLDPRHLPLYSSSSPEEKVFAKPLL